VKALGAHGLKDLARAEAVFKAMVAAAEARLARG